MKINRNNYESYLIDYLDGNLTPEEIRETEAFLLLHNNLSELLEKWDEATLKRPDISYSHKSLLKKDVLQGCPDYYAIAAAENCLTAQDKEFLKKHPACQKKIPFYSKLKLHADPEIQYFPKKKLYRPALPVRLVLRYSAIAVIAAIFLIIGYLFYFNPIKENSSRITLSEIEKISLNEEIKLCNSILSMEIIPIVNQQQTIISREILEPIPCSSLPETMLITSPPEISLIHNKPIITVLQPEIYLAENASVWKTSERSILSDNIFNSVISASKSWAEKLKNITK